MWKVQTDSYFTNPLLRIGMVSRPGGFKGLPDTEYISAGESTKSPDAIALGRHGNFFLWGFTASPRHMTDEAKVVFANAVAYTAGLKGKQIISRKYNVQLVSKNYIKDILHYLTRERHESSETFHREFYAKQADEYKKAKERQAKGEKLTKLELEKISRKPIVYKPTSWENYVKKYAVGALRQFGADADKMRAFLIENQDYLYASSDFVGFELDKDALSLKTSVMNHQLLDKAIALWESGKDIAMAKRILNRYTLCTFENVEQWREWYDTNKSMLYFTESGGWIYLVNSNDPTVEGNSYRAKATYIATRDMKFPKLTSSNPVAFSSKLVRYDGGQQAIVTRVKILDGFHIYSIVSEQDAYTETKFEYSLPDGVTLGASILPSDEPYTLAGTTRYTNDVTFVQFINGDVSSKDITVKYTYQCCDAGG